MTARCSLVASDSNGGEGIEWQKGRQIDGCRSNSVPFLILPSPRNILLWSTVLEKTNAEVHHTLSSLRVHVLVLLADLFCCSCFNLNASTGNVKAKSPPRKWITNVFYFPPLSQRRLAAVFEPLGPCASLGTHWQLGHCPRSLSHLCGCCCACRPSNQIDKPAGGVECRICKVCCNRFRVWMLGLL